MGSAVEHTGLIGELLEPIPVDDIAFDGNHNDVLLVCDGISGVPRCDFDVAGSLDDDVDVALDEGGGIPGDGGVAVGYGAVDVTGSIGIGDVLSGDAPSFVGSFCLLWIELGDGSDADTDHLACLRNDLGAERSGGDETDVYGRAVVLELFQSLVDHGWVVRWLSATG